MPAGVLVMLLQRLPAIRLAAQAESVFGAGLSALVRSGFVVATMGALDSVAGATVLASAPASPATATAGTSFSMVTTVNGAESSPQSMQYSGTLPPGLVASGSTSATVNTGISVNGSGVTNARYMWFTGKPTTAGTYTFTVTGWEGANATKNHASFSCTIKVTGGTTAPAITSEPLSVTKLAGFPASFTVAATGNPTPTYQWYKGTSSLNGETATTLAFAAVQLTDAGTYHVVATNSAGFATSNDVVLTVQTLPSVTSAANTTFEVGQAGTFTVTGSGVPAPTFNVSGLPTWASFSASTGVLTGTPPDANGSPYTLTFTPTSAAGTGSAQSFTLTVITRFEAWRQANFSAGELANATVSGPTAVLTADGLPNLLKFGLGYGPRDVVPGGIFTVAATGGQATFAFPRPVVNPGVVYSVEASTDLVSWDATGVTLAEVSNDGTTAQWRATLNPAGAKTFFRLVVSEP